MRRALKILASLVLLLVVGVIAVLALLPSEKIAQLAADQVKSATGRDLVISGKVSPSFYPVLGVETGTVTLSNAEWGKAEHMVSATSAKVGVELMPLLSGSVQVSEVRLVDPVIALEVNEDGAANWVFETAAAETTQTAPTDGESFVKEISLGEAVIENGAVSFVDRSTGQDIALDAINASISLDALDAPLRVDGDANWNGEATELALFLSTPAAAIAGEAIEMELDLSSAPASLSFDGTLTAPAPNQALLVNGAFGVTSADPAAAIVWATGAPAPDGLAGITDLKVDGTADLNLETASIAITGGATRDGQPATIDLKANGSADFAETLSLDVDLTATLGDLAALSYAGSVAPADGAIPVALTGSYDISGADPAGAAKWATGSAPEGLAGLSALAVAGQIEMSSAGLAATAKGGVTRDGTKAVVDLTAQGGADWLTKRAFTLAMTGALEGLADLSFNGTVAVPDGAAPAANGKLTLNAPDLKKVAAFAGATLPTAGAEAYRSLSLSGTLSTPGANAIKFVADKLQFDDINASGTISASLGNTPTIGANLNTGPLDLKPYVAGGESGPAGAPGWSKDRIDLSALGNLNGDFAIRAASVQLPQLSLGKSDLSAKLRNGKLDLKISELGFYGGGVQGDITVDGRNGNAIKANVSVAAVKLLPMLKALADLDAIEGTGKFKMNVSGQGASLHDIMNSLNGKGSVKLKNGALVGYNLAAMVRNVTSAFTGGDGSSSKTDFSAVDGTFDIKNGVLSNSDFSFLGPLIRISGEGTVDLGGQAMNFRLVPKAVASLKGQGGALDTKGLSFPVIVTGPWANLSFRPDLEGGIKNLLKDPDGAVDALGGVVDSLTKGGAAGAATEALKSVTKDAGGAAAEAVSKATGGNKEIGNAVGQLLGGGKKKVNYQPLINAVKKDIETAKASGDKAQLKAARKELKRLRAERKAQKEAANAPNPIGGLLKKLGNN